MLSVAHLCACILPLIILLYCSILLHVTQRQFFFNSHTEGLESILGPLGTSATEWPIVHAPGDCHDDGEFGGMKIGRGNRRTRGKPAPAQLCPPQITFDQTRDRTRPPRWVASD
jgi:hypothetical protein